MIIAGRWPMVTRTPRLRRHLHPVLRTPVPVRPPHEHARPPDQGPHRLEHRHRLPQQRRQGYGDAAADRPRHRYDIADDYMEVVYKLWEGKLGGRCRAARPQHAASPIPPRSTASGTTARTSASTRSISANRRPSARPVLFQAGASGRGRAFAARHAECVFINGPSKQVDRPDRRRPPPPRRRGRPRPGRSRHLPHDDRDHRHHDRSARRTSSPIIAATPRGRRLVLMSGWTGVDFSRLGPTRSSASRQSTRRPRRWRPSPPPIPTAPGPCARSRPRRHRRAQPAVGRLASEVAEELQAWVEETGVDGFNLAYAVTPGTFHRHGRPRGAGTAKPRTLQT